MKHALIALCLSLMLALAACVPAGGGTAPAGTAAPVGTEAAAKTEAPAATKAPVQTEAPAGWDFDNRFCGGQDNIVETEDVIYYGVTSASYLYYYDKASGISGVLCPKPECVHDAKSDNTECAGFLMIAGSSLNLIDGRLYYCAFDNDLRCEALFSIKPDGTDRRRVCGLEECNIYETGSLTKLDHHRGRLYGYGVYQRVTDAEPDVGLNVFCIDPETGDVRVLREYKQKIMPFADLYYYRQYVYFCSVNSFTENGAEVEIMRWNTETSELENVFTGRDIEGALFSIRVIGEDRIMLAPRGVAEGEPQSVYVISDGELKKAFDFELWGASFIVEGVAVCIYPAGGVMEIRTFEGDLVYKGDMGTGFLKELGESLEIGGVISVYGDANEIFVSYSVADRGDMQQPSDTCLVRYDLTAEHPAAELLVYSPWR